MVQGYAVPRSPLGLAAIDPPPPWHYSGDVVGAEFWADPSATTALLPEGLTPDPETNGRALLMFVDWQFTGHTGTAHWPNGVEAQLTIERFDADQVCTRRCYRARCDPHRIVRWNFVGRPGEIFAHRLETQAMIIQKLRSEALLFAE